MYGQRLQIITSTIFLIRTVHSPNKSLTLISEHLHTLQGNPAGWLLNSHCKNIKNLNGHLIQRKLWLI